MTERINCQIIRYSFGHMKQIDEIVVLFLSCKDGLTLRRLNKYEESKLNCELLNTMWIWSKRVDTTFTNAQNDDFHLGIGQNEVQILLQYLHVHHVVLCSSKIVIYHHIPPILFLFLFVFFYLCHHYHV